MTNARRSIDVGRWTLVLALAVTVGYTGCLQVRANYARNEVVESARELVEPVADLCRDDPVARRRLGDATCRWATDVVEPTGTSTSLDNLVGRDVLTLLVPDDH